MNKGSTSIAIAGGPAGLIGGTWRGARRALFHGRDHWHSFWYEPADPFTLGMIRLLTGWMLVYSLLVWGLNLDAFFGEHGLQPLDAIRDFHARGYAVTFWLWVPEPWIATVHWLCVAVAMCFFLGLGTRVTSVAAWMIALSYSQRVPVANFGLDQILGFLCMYLAIGPCGDSLSLDALIRRHRQKQKGRTEEPAKKSSARVALRLIQLHMCVIYFWAGFAKLKGDSWWTGEAMWRVIANQEYQTMDLTWMAWIPWLPYLIAHVTVAWEVFFCVLIWIRPLRPVLLLIGTGMHFGIGAFLGMWTFGLIMTYAYFAFSEPQEWRRRITGVIAHFGGPVVTAENKVGEAIADSTADPAATGPPVRRLRPASRKPDMTRKPGSAATVAAALHAASSGSESDAKAADTIISDRHTQLLLLSKPSNERQTLRRYFRNNDIPCRAVNSSESALTLVLPLAPAAIVVSGSGMSDDKVAAVIEDLIDLSDAPLITILSPSQQQLLPPCPETVHILSFPTTPRAIRREVTRALFGDAANESPSTPAKPPIENPEQQEPR